MDAFVYCWTNSSTNKLYIGSHKGTPDDGYVCSSKYMLEDYMKDRRVFTRQIIATGTYEDMVAFEATLLQTVNAAKDPQFYNMHNGDGEFYLKRHTEESKKRISESKKGTKRPDLALINMQGPRGYTGRPMKGDLNPMHGKNHTQESKDKMSSNRKGKGRQPKSPETREKMRLAALKRWEKQRGN